MSDARAHIEELVRKAWDEQDYDTATTIAIREYGPEILGVLTARLRSQSDASEVFSQFCEDFWKGLPNFRWKCSVRVWGYTLARHASVRYVKSAHRRRERNLPLSEHPALGQLVQDIRTTTLAHLRTENRSRMRELREELSELDQELLILRVDKQMSWRDMAMVMSDSESAEPGKELDREAARLRKRFQLAKEKLRKLAQREGLI